MMQSLSAIVIPCLNEQDNLAATCQSLGFGPGQHSPANAVLILVDNGSEDATIAVAEDVRRHCPTGAVIVSTEPERGYVPPRHHGNRLAVSSANSRGVPVQDLIIIQADADTIYGDCYVEAISEAARRNGRGVLIDACSQHESEFAAKYAEYIVLCNEVDNEIDWKMADQQDDVVVDDKACGYWASDYDLWGGHQREYSSQGEEIHAETTRLYIRARTYGASRSPCTDAVAKHSGRKLVADPAYGFASAGFPREQTFCNNWRRSYDGPSDIGEFCKASNRAQIALAVRSRRAHNQGLFQMLSEHVRFAVDSASRVVPRAADVVGLPTRDAEMARLKPGLLIEDVFAKVDSLVFSTP